jgi:myo-inositol-1(or 4)-monophosphatase
MTDSEHEQALLAVAQEAAGAAAAELSGRFGHHQRGVHAKSGPTDLVSDADVAAEAAIRAVLARRAPGDAILGEEGGASGDGTINFLFGIPVFAVSVACQDEHGALAGVVLDPIREECFAATRSGPSTLNGVEIVASRQDVLSQALVATGFGYDANVRGRQAEVLVRVLPRVRDIRRAGAAAIDLAWCACGRVDAYFERGVHAWDIAAGVLIAERSGLPVRELAAEGEDPSGLLTAPGALIDELQALVLGR